EPLSATRGGENRPCTHRLGPEALRASAYRDAARAERVHVGEDLVEPGGGLVLVHLLRVHELAREDLLRLDEHLLLAGREALLVVAQREVPYDLGQLEDVARLHLVAVVLEAAVPVLRHHGAAAGERLEDL